MQTPDRGKSKALRIRLDYHRQTSALDRARRSLMLISLACSAAYVLWLVLPSVGGSSARNRLHLSTGPLAQVHAAFENDCEKCHTHGLAAPLGKNSFQLEPSRRLDHQESSCQSCHRVDGHWRASLQDPSEDRDCANCHHEHNGRTASLTDVANKACASCHRDLQAVCRTGTLEASTTLPVKDFSAASHGVRDTKGRMQFRSLLVDRGRVKFDHAQHLRPGQVDAGQRGGMRLDMLPAIVRDRYRQKGQADTALVSLDCASCHQLHALRQGQSHAVGSEEGRYYAPIDFESHCQACHQMTFPGQTGQMLPLPHVASMAEYELLLGARNQAPAVRSRTQSAINDSIQSVAVSQESLMQRCQQCHMPDDLTPKAIDAALAGQMQPLIPNRWLVNGYFDHAAHGRVVNCRFCHDIPGTVVNGNTESGHTSPPTDQEQVFIRGPSPARSVIAQSMLRQSKI